MPRRRGVDAGGGRSQNEDAQIGQNRQVTSFEPPVRGFTLDHHHPSHDLRDLDTAQDTRCEIEPRILSCLCYIFTIAPRRLVWRFLILPIQYLRDTIPPILLTCETAADLTYK